MLCEEDGDLALCALDGGFVCGLEDEGGVPVLRVVEASILTPRYLFCTLDMTVESLVTDSCESESEKDCWAMARWMTGAEPAQVETGAAPFAPH